MCYQIYPFNQTPGPSPGPLQTHPSSNPSPGSVSVGKIVAKAAAVNLTPVTLELGGKCPVIVDEHTNIDTAAKRIIWGKVW